MSHLAVIDPAAKVAELDCYNWISRQSPLPTTYHLPGIFGCRSLELAPEPRGILILGSRTSVYDPLEWKDALMGWLKPRLEKGIPTLGICYGHQLVCHLFGGTVGFLAGGTKLQGFREVEVAPLGPWAHLPRKGKLFVSHREAVTQPPPNFVPLATSPQFPWDGLAHRTLPLWTFQPHPEATRGLMENLSYAGEDESGGYGLRLVEAFLQYVGRQK